MINQLERFFEKAAYSVVNRLQLPLSGFRRRFGFLNNIAPGGIVILVILFQIGPVRWIHNRLGMSYHLAVEILFYSSSGLALGLLLLDFLNRWQEERETSDLQAQVLARSQEQAKTDLEIRDDAIQALFATSLLLASLEANLPALTPEAAAHLQAAKRALYRSLRELQASLSNELVSQPGIKKELRP